MKISGQTKVSHIIKHHIEAIDVIASINSNFKKLKNPILRAVLAPRITLEEASRIGKCPLDVLLNKLSEIGFEIELGDQSNIDHSETRIHQEEIEQFTFNKQVITFDVRPILEQNKDPFNEIMTQLKSINQNNVLAIINSFEPIPLIRIVKTKGYECLTIHEGDAFRTLIKAGDSQTDSPSTSNHKICTKEEFEVQLNRFKGKLVELDVRELEMPLPMITILEEIEKITTDNALFVFHKKIPQYLLPELAERGFTTSILEIAEGNVNLLIYK